MANALVWLALAAALAGGAAAASTDDHVGGVCPTVFPVDTVCYHVLWPACHHLVEAGVRIPTYPCYA